MLWQLNDNIDDKEIGTFTLIEGKYLVKYIQTRTTVKLEYVNSIKDVNLNLFKVTDTNDYICLIKDYDLIKSSEAIELLKNYILNSKNFVVVQNKSLLEYQTGTQFEDDCIIRKISTANSTENVQYPKLEQPNIISGIGAGGMYK